MKFIFFICVMLLFASCKKDGNNMTDTGIRGRLTLEFDNIAGTADLVMGTGLYFNSSREPLSVDILRYYVSNFIFTNEDGTEYRVPQDSCYFLIDESKQATLKPLFSLPAAIYKTVQFTIGVDSLRSTMDITDRTGVLDPATLAGDMYWGWNSGYIFLKMEGRSDAAALDGDVIYHIGGFGGYSAPTINNIRTVTLNLQERGVAIVRADITSNLIISADILKLFDGTEVVSVAEHPVEMFTPYSTTISENYSRMFSHISTENE